MLSRRSTVVSALVYLFAAHGSWAAAQVAGDLSGALLHAVGDGDLTETKRLLAAGVSAATASPDGETPLHLVGITGDAAFVPLLVEAGGDPNARATAPASLDMTPLTWCVYGLHARATRALIAAGADVNLVVRTEDGGRVTALDLARMLAANNDPDGTGEGGADGGNAAGIAASRDLVAAIEAAGGVPFAELPVEEQEHARRELGKQKREEL